MDSSIKLLKAETCLKWWLMNWINQENNDNYFDKSINLWLAFESHYFSGHTKALNIILKTKQMTILHAQWDKCALY